MPTPADPPHQLTTHSIPTTHGTIHVLDTGTPPPPPNQADSPLPTLLLLHGNSSNSRIFLPLIRLSRAALPRHRTLALDLPGHGASTDAPDPVEDSYTQPAYADAAIQVLDALGVGDVVVLGWSLGGHNAIEMVAQTETPTGKRETGRGRREVRGIMITGTPPALGLEQTQRGFTLGGEEKGGGGGGEEGKGGEGEGEGGEGGDEGGGGGGEHVNLAGTETWSERDFDVFPFEAARGERAPWIREAAVRTDGRARRVMFDAFEAGRGADQVKVVRESGVPCAVVNGGDEPFVNLDYLDALEYVNLWEGRCHRLPGLGHAPFWEQPETFLPYWERFVKHCSGEA